MLIVPCILQRPGGWTCVDSSLYFTDTDLGIGPLGSAGREAGPVRELLHLPVQRPSAEHHPTTQEQGNLLRSASILQTCTENQKSFVLCDRCSFVRTSLDQREIWLQFVFFFRPCFSCCF